MGVGLPYHGGGRASIRPGPSVRTDGDGFEPSLSGGQTEDVRGIERSGKGSSLPQKQGGCIQVQRTAPALVIGRTAVRIGSGCWRGGSGLLGSLLGCLLDRRAFLGGVLAEVNFAKGGESGKQALGRAVYRRPGGELGVAV